MRNCKNCKHLIMYDYKNKSYSCEKWECKFEPKEQEPTTKNDLSSGLEKNSQRLEKDFGELDCISRADAIRVASGYCHPSNVAKELAKLPSVTPQEPVKKLEEQIKKLQNRCYVLAQGQLCVFCPYECEHKAEVEPQKSEGDNG